METKFKEIVDWINSHKVTTIIIVATMITIVDAYIYFFQPALCKALMTIMDTPLW